MCAVSLILRKTLVNPQTSQEAIKSSSDDGQGGLRWGADYRTQDKSVAEATKEFKP